MAVASASRAIPTAGTFPVSLSSRLFPGSKKRKRPNDELVSLKYAFKPASMNSVTEASIVPQDNGFLALHADTESHGTQVFDLKQEQSKPRECVLVYDPETKSFSIHPLATTASLTLNRSPATTFSIARPSTSTSESSTTSSASLPLAQRKRTVAAENADSTRAKRRRPSEIAQPTSQAQPARPSRGGKSLPRKSLPAAVEEEQPAPPAKGKGRGKANPKKAAAAPKKTAKKAAPAPTGKYKSAEIIEDSDEEYDMGTEPVEEEDEFAKMLGASLAEADEADASDDEDEDEDEDEEEDDELGGARLVVRQQGTGYSGDGETEWL